MQACLCDGGSAVASWLEFRRGFDLDADGPLYMPFLPLVEQNLGRIGFEESLAGRFRGMRRQIWYRNQLYTKKIADLIASLQTAKVDPICFSDLAISQIFHSNPGLRPIRCAEFLVKDSELAVLNELLRDASWQPSGNPWQGHYLAFTDIDGFAIALHIHTGIGGLPLEDISDRAVKFDLPGVQARAASSLDQLLLLLGRPFSRQNSWMLKLVDSATIMRNSAADIDWQQAHDQPLRLVPRLRFCDSLRTLSTGGFAPISPSLYRSLLDVHGAGRHVPDRLLTACTKIGGWFPHLNR